jgi:hypothetical protein
MAYLLVSAPMFFLLIFCYFYSYFKLVNYPIKKILVCTARFIVPVLMILLLWGCEYEPEKENFREVEPPSMYRTFDLEITPSTDTIEVFNTAQFLYNINAGNLRLQSGGFSMAGVNWKIFSYAGEFTINPVEFRPGLDTLKLQIITNSGTGSLADFAGVEGYMVERHWLFLIDGRPAPYILSSWSVTPEKYLKISWTKCDQYNFKSYELEGSANSNIIKKTYTDKEITSYVDSFFVGGDANYRISSRVITGNQHTWGQSIRFSTPTPVMYFSGDGTDSLRISWDRSMFNAKYRLYSQNQVLFESSTDTSFTVVHPGFGRFRDFGLYVMSSVNPSPDSWYTLKKFQNYSLGQSIAGNSPVYGYNHIDKVVYTNTYNDIQCFDAETAGLLRKYRIENLIYSGYYACPTNSTRVAVLSRDSIYVFDNKALQKPQTIRYYTGNNSVEHFFYADNDIIAVAFAKNYNLVSIAEKKIKTVIPVDDYPVYSKWACISTSKDAGYFCIVTLNGIKLYKNENWVAELTYSDSRVYRSVLFDINDPEKLYLTFNNSNLLEIRNPVDFSLLGSFYLPTNAQVFCNMDPETGYMLLTDYSFIYVVDPLTGEVALRMLCNVSRPRLFNSRLYSETGFTYSIKHLLPQ